MLYLLAKTVALDSENLSCRVFDSLIDHDIPFTWHLLLIVARSIGVATVFQARILSARAKGPTYSAPCINASVSRLVNSVEDNARGCGFEPSYQNCLCSAHFSSSHFQFRTSAWIESQTRFCSSWQCSVKVFQSREIPSSFLVVRVHRACSRAPLSLLPNITPKLLFLQQYWR